MTQIQIDTPSPAPGTQAFPPAARTLNPENIRQPRQAVPADKYGWWWGTGRRKSAVARVRIRLAKEEGKAVFQIESNSSGPRPVEEYFSEERDRADCHAALKATNTEGRFDIRVKCHGGGYMGQAQAVRLGIARALRDYDPSLEDALRDAGYLTRDAREVERKKYGQAGARRRFQFSKR
jgi:small subunit ribosomal protein S9